MSEERRVLIRKVVKNMSIILCEELMEELRDVERRSNRIWTRQWILNRSLGAGASNGILRELRETDPKHYRDVLRLSPEQFNTILNLISPLIQKNDTLMREAIAARTKLEITLCYLATGVTFNILSILFRVSKSAISYMIPEVCDAITKILENDYLKVPKKMVPIPPMDQLEEIQLGFAERWNFPSCCGSIDGKHISIKAPPNSGSEYYNYKHRNSIVLMAVVDHDYCFRYIDVGSYGRNADAGVFQKSSLYQKLENNSLLPEGGFLVGDDAFPLKPYLLKPYSRAAMNYPERIFNYRLSRARRIVENGFGILASRFRVLVNDIIVDVSTTEKIVVAACALHNWLRMTSPSTYTPPGSIDYEDALNATVIQGQWRSEVSQLRSVHRSRVNRNKRIAENLRDKYKNYFVGEGAVDWQDKMI